MSPETQSPARPPSPRLPGRSLPGPGLPGPGLPGPGLLGPGLPGPGLPGPGLLGLCLLGLCLLSAGCGASEEPSPAHRRQVPIEAPDPSAEGPAHCPDGRVDEAWTYQWAGDRLVAAERLRGPLRDQDALEWSAAGLVAWVRTGTEPLSLRFERDAAGVITGWTRILRDGPPLQVSVTELERGVRLHLRGPLYDALVPFDREAFDLTALPDVARALPSVALLTEILLARHLGDELGLAAALAEADLEEERRFDMEGRLIETRFDLDGDGAPDAVELRIYGEGQRTVRLDVDGDGAAERVVATRFDGAGRPVSEQVEGGAEIRWEYLDGLSKRHSTPPAGPTQVTWIYTRPDGKRLLKYEDYDGDGLAEWRRRYWHTAAGARTFAERDRDVDGIIDQRVEHDLDADERRVGTRIVTPDPQGCGGRW